MSVWTFFGNLLIKNIIEVIIEDYVAKCNRKVYDFQ